MTQIKEKAVEMIERMPEEKMYYVINILQNLEAMSKNAVVDRERAVDALQNILTMEKRLPDDFDPDKELMEALDEKHGSVG